MAGIAGAAVVLQGLVFASVPMPLAIAVMRPRHELMNSLVVQGP
jgi:hypothetical protein